jgi:hypothetical protein
MNCYGKTNSFTEVPAKGLTNLSRLRNFYIYKLYIVYDFKGIFKRDFKLYTLDV